MSPVAQVKKYGSWAHKIYCQFAQLANEKLKNFSIIYNNSIEWAQENFCDWAQLAKLHPCFQYMKWKLENQKKIANS
jgi:hypothetical protein